MIITQVAVWLRSCCVSILYLLRFGCGTVAALRVIVRAVAGILPGPPGSRGRFCMTHAQMLCHATFSASFHTVVDYPWSKYFQLYFSAMSSVPNPMLSTPVSPRVNSARLPDFVGRSVRLVGKVIDVRVF